jgi:hypothetical protein
VTAQRVKEFGGNPGPEGSYELLRARNNAKAKQGPWAPGTEAYATKHKDELTSADRGARTGQLDELRGLGG